MIPAVLLPHFVLLFGALVCSIGGRVINWPVIWKFAGLLFCSGAAWLCFTTSVADDPLTGVVVRNAFAKLVSLVGYATVFLLILTCLERNISGVSSGDQSAFFLLGLFGLNLAAQTDDLFLLYLGVEISSFSLLVLILLPHQNSGVERAAETNRQKQEAALKFFFRNAVSTALLLLGFAFLYGMTGSTELSLIEHVFSETSASSNLDNGQLLPPLLGVFTVILIISGLGIRMAAVPFQSGIPDIFQGVSSWVAGTLAMLPLLTCWVVLFRLTGQCLVGYEVSSVLLLIVLSVLSMSLGNVLALHQTQLRRLWAYLVMVQCGFLLAATAVSLWGQSHQSAFAHKLFTDTNQTALLVLISYLINTAGLTAVCVYLTRGNRDLEYLDDLTGIVRSEPIAALCGVLSLLGLVGAPFLSGFWWRVFVLLQGLSLMADKPIPATHASFLFLSLMLVINLVVLWVVILRIVVTVIFSDQLARPKPAGGETALAAAMLATFLNVGIGLFPGMLLSLLR